MTLLLGIEAINIPARVVNSTFDFLQKYGHKQLESHSIWVGRKTNAEFNVLDAWFPVQNNSCVSYEVPEAEEFKINVKLNRQNLVAIAQIHTHPTSAFHSAIDDEGSELVLPGSLSIVIPNFGFIKRDAFVQWEIYRHTGRSWEPLSDQEACKLCHLV